LAALDKPLVLRYGKKQKRAPMDSTELGVPATFFSPSPLSANRDPPAASDSLKIQRAAHRPAAAFQDVGVDHGGADVFMPEEFLDGADIIAGLEQMGCKGVAQGVAGDALLEAGFWAAWRTARCRAEGSM
jgi:hypothetical protein